MEPEVSNGDDRRADRPRFQFSLRTMFVVTTIAAAVFPLLFASPGIVRMISAAFLLVMFPVVLTTVLIHGRGYARTFCMGALFPAGTALWPIGQNGSIFMFAWERGVNSLGPIQFGPAVFVFVTLGTSIVAGLLAVLVRWLIERQQGTEALSGSATTQSDEMHSATSTEP